MPVVNHRDVADSGGTVWRVTVDTDGLLQTASQGAGSADDWYLADSSGTVWQIQVDTSGVLFTSQVDGTLSWVFLINGSDRWAVRVATDGVLFTALWAGMPTLTFEAAFGVGPGSVPADGDWVDLSSRLLARQGSIKWSGGRQTELDRMEASVGDVLLDNDDRALDPDYSSSPYYPDVKPMTRVRLRADHAGETFDVFEGFVEAWPQSWEGMTFGVSHIRIVDGTKLLAMSRTSAGYAQEASGTRVGNLLDAAGWPAGKRSIDGGQSNVQGRTPDRRAVINEIRDVEEAEAGIFFIGPDGDATFRDRDSRILSESLATFGDDGDELPYQHIEIPHDDEHLWNDIAVKPDGITVENAEDADSISDFFRRSLPEFGALITTALEAADRANWELNRSKDPRTRIEGLTLLGHSNPEVMEHILRRTFGDRITARRRPQSIGSAIEEDAHIEHIHHEISAKSWKAVWRTSPASLDAVWLIGTDGSSELGETTVLGY